MNHDNLIKIKYINKQKKQSVHVDASFNTGLIIIKNINHIHKLEKIKVQEKLHYVIVIRQKLNDILLEHLVKNYKFIDMHLTEENLCDEKNINYKKLIINYYFKNIN